MTVRRLLACLAPGLALVAAVSSPSAALAGAFGIREQSTTALGMAFGGAAAGAGGATTMFWNPAIMTQLPGIHSDWSFTAILPSTKFTVQPGSSPFFASGSSGDIIKDGVVPAGATSWQVNDRLWLGLSLSVPYALSSKPDVNWPGRVYGSTTKVTSLDIAPTVAYRVNDWLSIGGSLRFEHFSSRYTSALYDPNPFLGIGPNPASWPVVGLQGDSWGVGYALGVTIDPWQGTTIGIGYRSAIQQSVKGTFSGLPGFGALVVPTRPASVNVMTPDTVTIGLRQRVNDRFSISAGFEWTNWSRLRYPRVIDETTGLPYAASPLLYLGYKDGWFASLGAEYAVTPQWTVRAGVAYEKSPIDTAVRGLRLPDSDRVWATLGASYAWNERLTFDVAYAHIFARNATVSMQPGSPGYQPGYGPLLASADSQGDIFSAGLRFSWDDPARPVPAAMPVVRKD